MSELNNIRETARYFTVPEEAIEQEQRQIMIHHNKCVEAIKLHYAKQGITPPCTK